MKSWILDYKAHLVSKKIKLLEIPRIKSDCVLHKCLICDHIWKPKVLNVLGGGNGKGTGCPQCSLAASSSRRISHGSKTFTAALRVSSFKPVSEYIDNKTFVTLKCTKCRTCTTRTPAGFRRIHFKCVTCTPPKLKSFSLDVQKNFLEVLTSRNYKLLSTYRGIAKKVKLQCYCGNKWRTLPFSITSGYGCPSCAILKSHAYKSCSVEGVDLRLQGNEPIALHWLLHVTSCSVKDFLVGKGQVQTFKYSKHGKVHKYNPDFQINTSIIEVKSTYTAGLLNQKIRSTDPDFSELKAKARAVIRKGYRFHLLIFKVDKGRIYKAIVPRDWLKSTRKDLLNSICWVDITYCLPLDFRRKNGYK